MRVLCPGSRPMGWSISAVALFRAAVHQGQVGLGHPAFGEIPGQLQAHGFTQGHQQQARGILVDAVDNARPLSLDPGQLREKPHQPVDQGSLRTARGGVHREPGRLVHHQQVLVAVDHGHRSLLRERPALGLRHIKAQPFAAAQLPGRLTADLAVHPGQAALDPLLEPGAGHALPGQESGPELVQPPRPGHGFVACSFLGVAHHSLRAGPDHLAPVGRIAYTSPASPAQALSTLRARHLQPRSPHARRPLPQRHRRHRGPPPPHPRAWRGTGPGDHGRHLQHRPGTPQGIHALFRGARPRVRGHGGERGGRPRPGGPPRSGRHQRRLRPLPPLPGERSPPLPRPAHPGHRQPGRGLRPPSWSSPWSTCDRCPTTFRTPPPCSPNPWPRPWKSPSRCTSRPGCPWPCWATASSACWPPWPCACTARISCSWAATRRSWPWPPPRA